MKSALLIVAIGVAAAAPFCYTGVYVPQRTQIARIRAEVAAEQLRQQTETDVAALLQQREGYRKRLPAEPDPSWLVQELLARAQQAGLQVMTISQDSPQSVGPFTHLSVSLQIAASYHELGLFLDAIERSDRFIRVERIDANRPERQELSPIQVTFSTLYVPPMSEAANQGA